MADSVSITSTPPVEDYTWESEENWNVNEHWLFHNTVTWDVSTNQTFGTVDKISGFDIGVGKSEKIKVADKDAITLSAALVDSFKVTDKLSRTISFGREYDEAFALKQGFAKDVEKESFQEKFGVVDSAPIFLQGVNCFETLKTSDKIAFKTSYILSLKDSWKTKETISNNPSLPFSSSFGMVDGMKMPANGIYSDLMFEDGEWSMASMKTYMFKGKHVGYENFKTFIAGDYTYDKALFRTTISTETADRGLIEQWQLTVDVPDISDRGSAEVKDANFELTVNFNKTFHIAPEVVCTMRSGSSNEPITVNISTITETYFKVSLINSLTGKTTTGRFIWSAQGY